MPERISLKDFQSDETLVKRARRGRAVAKALDAGAPLPYAITLSCLELGAFLAQLTPKRLELLRVAHQKPRSISELSLALHREQSAVSKDVGRLKALGLLNVEETSNSGHGKKKIVTAASGSIIISANLAN